MGGEKLNSHKPDLGIFLGIFLFFAVFFGTAFPLSAQVSGDSEAAQVTPSSAVDESAIILGEQQAAASQQSGSSILIVLRMVLVLALAALAIYGVVFFIKRLAKPRESHDPHLKVLARTALSSDTYAAVLSVGRKAWLVAGGGGSVNLISEIEEGETLETMLLDDARKAAEAGTKPLLDFRSLISKFGSPVKHKRNSSPDNESLAENLRRQRERLGGQ